MEAELTALAASGATTLVGLMVSDAWARTRQRLERFLARGGDGSAAARELQLSQEELVAARAAGDEGAAADIEAEWRTRLRRVLRADPAAAGELRALLAELDPAAGGGQVNVVNNSFSGVANGPVFQGQNYSIGSFHSGSAPVPVTDRAPDRRGSDPA
ncbi:MULTISPECIES: hypothetical protein [unclassified Streptomyces]|uniref:hypothetical protein n=1 Tax=unclassified Streptomyces TaxID=2593676 RepID=UPI002E2C0DD7|nr:hypothetical protein [Streptomyces sp. NBC_00223]